MEDDARADPASPRPEPAEREGREEDGEARRVWRREEMAAAKVKPGAVALMKVRRGRVTRFAAMPIPK